MTKQCYKCGEVKPVSEFYRRTDTPSGLRGPCKLCQRVYSVRFRKKNPGKIKAASNKHYKENKATLCIKRAIWRKENTERVRASDKKCHDKKMAVIRSHKEDRGCLVCGEKAAACLVFHHRKSGSRCVKTGRSFSNLYLRRIKEEFEKCEVLCANCHMIFHEVIGFGTLGFNNTAKEIIAIVKEYRSRPSRSAVVA